MKYKIILADPPWAYRNMGNIQNNVLNHYNTMSNEDIENLNINDISDDNSILFLWCTFPKLQEGLNTIKAWGFEYKTIGFIWVKTNKNNNKPFFGVGWYTKSNAEVCLIGVKGKAPKISNSVSSVVISKREEHSKKPDEVKKRIIEFCGDIKRIELFAREKSHGFDVWGNEINNDIELGFKK
jgi:N6-adenosine-specific RNA methylase IME4